MVKLTRQWWWRWGGCELEAVYNCLTKSPNNQMLLHTEKMTNNRTIQMVLIRKPIETIRKTEKEIHRKRERGPLRKRRLNNDYYKDASYMNWHF